MAEKPKLHRKKHKNSRIGCPQCKQRRVKCDETLPHCNKCASRSIRCGYLDYTEHQLELIRLSHCEIEETQLYLQTFYQPQQQQQQQQQLRQQYQHQQPPPIEHQQHLPTPTFIGREEARYEDPLPSPATPYVPRSHDELKHPIQRQMQHYVSESSNGSTPETMSSPASSLTVRISLEPVQTGSITEIPLIKHTSTLPKFDMKKFPPHFGETFAGSFARVFLLQEMHNRMTLAYVHSKVFDVTMLFGIGVLLRDSPQLRYHFLKHRGSAMRFVTEELTNVNDDNALRLLTISIVLLCTSVYLKNVPMADHFAMSQGPSALIIACFEDPTKFPKSFPVLKFTADGLRFTSRYVYHPAYDHKVLHEFLEVVEEFGSKFLTNEDLVDSDDEIHIHYHNLVDFIRFSLNFMENERSNKHVLRFPVNTLYSLLQRWYDTVPSASYAVHRGTDPVNKIIYAFWNALAEVLEEILVGSRYIFTFLFNGFHWLFPLSKDSLLHNLPVEYKTYAHYCCRLMAFMGRRRHFIVRNTVLNDPIPTFFDEKDRFKPRQLDIEEECIARFRETLIEPLHFPSESSTKSAIGAANGNYYKGAASQTARDTAIIQGMNRLQHSNGEIGSVDMLDFDEETCMLHDDFDPLATDPIFNNMPQFQSADLDFVRKYNEDRKLIIQLDNE